MKAKHSADESADIAKKILSEYNNRVQKILFLDSLSE